MEYATAYKIACETLEQLRPYCNRIEIAGSIRRKKKTNIKDVEIVCIPKPYDVGLFSTGIATVVNQWKKVRGELPCRYTQRILPCGAKLDLFITEQERWGMTFALRTGSADYSYKVLGSGWVARGYKSVDGWLTYKGKKIVIREEIDLFNKLGMDYVNPENREV